MSTVEFQLTSFIAALAKGGRDLESIVAGSRSPVAQVLKVATGKSPNQVTLSDGKCYTHAAFAISSVAASLQKGDVISLHRYELRVTSDSSLLFVLLVEVDIVALSQPQIGSPRQLAPHRISPRALARLSQLRIFRPAATNAAIGDVAHVHTAMNSLRHDADQRGTMLLHAVPVAARTNSEALDDARQGVATEDDGQPPPKRAEPVGGNMASSSEALPVQTEALSVQLAELAASVVQPSSDTPQAATCTSPTNTASCARTDSTSGQLGHQREQQGESQLEDAGSKANRELFESGLPPSIVIANYMKSRRIAAIPENVDVSTVRRVTIADMCAEAEAQTQCDSGTQATLRTQTSGFRFVVVLVEKRYGKQVFTYKSTSYVPNATASMKSSNTLMNLLLSDHTCQIQACVYGDEDVRKFEDLKQGVFYYLFNPELRRSNPQSLAMQVVCNPYQMSLGRRTNFAPVCSNHLDDFMRGAVAAEVERSWYSSCLSLADVYARAADRSNLQTLPDTTNRFDPMVNVLVVVKVSTMRRFTYDRSNTVIQSGSSICLHAGMSGNTYFAAPIKPKLEVTVCDNSMPTGVLFHAWNDFSDTLERILLEQTQRKSVILFLKTVRATMKSVAPVQQENGGSEVPTPTGISELILNTVDKSQIELLEPQLARTREMRLHLEALLNLHVPCAEPNPNDNSFTAAAVADE